MQTLEEQLRFVLVRQINRGQQSIKLLARRSGLSVSMVSNFVRGRRSASMAGFSWLLEAAGFEAQIFPKEQASANRRNHCQSLRKSPPSAAGRRADG